VGVERIRPRPDRGEIGAVTPNPIEIKPPIEVVAEQIQLLGGDDLELLQFLPPLQEVH